MVCHLVMGSSMLQVMVYYVGVMMAKISQVLSSHNELTLSIPNICWQLCDWLLGLYDARSEPQTHGKLQNIRLCQYHKQICNKEHSRGVEKSLNLFFFRCNILRHTPTHNSASSERAHSKLKPSNYLTYWGLNKMSAIWNNASYFMNISLQIFNAIPCCCIGFLLWFRQWLYANHTQVHYQNQCLSPRLQCVKSQNPIKSLICPTNWFFGWYVVILTAASLHPPHKSLPHVGLS